MNIILVSGAQEINDSRFNSKIRSVYNWRIEALDKIIYPEFAIGNIFELIINKIQENSNQSDINVTLSLYNNFNEKDLILYNETLLIYNELLEKLFYHEDLVNNIELGWFFILPIPLNLSILEPYFAEDFTTNIVGNTIICVSTMDPLKNSIPCRIIMTYGNNGILQSSILMVNGKIIYKISLKGNSVSFANWFLFFSIVSIIGISTYTIKRRKITFIMIAQENTSL
ncbi:MAG: hypothetical protein KGD63_04810 [Candidatus Lokiarchaeota archaeon]|nr:hypothetical protein [Candidatus Lokiarchaeota archaeon]